MLYRLSSFNSRWLQWLIQSFSSYVENSTSIGFLERGSLPQSILFSAPYNSTNVLQMRPSWAKIPASVRILSAAYNSRSKSFGMLFLAFLFSYSCANKRWYTESFILVVTGCTWESWLKVDENRYTPTLGKLWFCIFLWQLPQFWVVKQLIKIGSHVWAKDPCVLWYKLVKILEKENCYFVLIVI